MRRGARRRPVERTVSAPKDRSDRVTVARGKILRQAIFKEKPNTFVLMTDLWMERTGQCTWIGCNEDMSAGNYFKQVGVNRLRPNFDLKSEFFLNLACQALHRSFARFDPAAGKLPLVSLVLKQDDPSVPNGQNTLDGNIGHATHKVGEATRKVEPTTARATAVSLVLARATTAPTCSAAPFGRRW